MELRRHCTDGEVVMVLKVLSKDGHDYVERINKEGMEYQERIEKELLKIAERMLVIITKIVDDRIKTDG